MEDYKQKYESALKVASKWHKDGIKDIQLVIECIFPELKESEDERMKKNIKIALMSMEDNLSDFYSTHHTSQKELLAWIEKQGEHKTVSKTEPIVEGLTTEFQKQVSYLIASAMDKEHEYNWSYVKWTANALLNYAKHELEKQGEQSIYDVPSRNMILAVWELGNEWKELTNGSISKEYGTQLEYIQKHWNESQYYLRDKQGEQKPVDKVELKFHSGDFITDGERIFQIKETVWERNNRNDGTTYCESLIVNLRDGVTYANNTDLKEYHLWAIQDAKDGDVLSFNDGHGNDCIELIKSITGKKIEFWFCLTNGNRYEVFDGITPYTNFTSREDATPATKEQRDTLMKAMADAGYTFDFEKKELKKIKKPSEWSEEDESMLDYIVHNILFAETHRKVTGSFIMEKEQIDWLKSLKERIKNK